MKNNLFERCVKLISILISEIESDLSKNLELKEKKTITELIDKLIQTTIKLEKIKQTGFEEDISHKDLQIINDFLEKAQKNNYSAQK